MRKLSDVSFRLGSPKELLLFLLGLFSTWQILQVAGLALSTWITVITTVYLLLTQGLYFRKDWLLLSMLASALLTFAVSMISDIPSGYKKPALMGILQWALIFIACCYMRKEQTASAVNSFMKGFDWSCRIQLFWCLLQMVAYYGLKLDINNRIFGDLLHTNSETSQYRNGVLACTGLHWHAANLIPVLIYTYFRHRNVFIKALCFVIVYFTKNATSMLAIGFSLVLDLLIFAKHTLCDQHCGIPKKIAVYIMLGAGGFLCLSPILLPKLWEVISYLLLRLYEIQNPTLGHESSTVHFNYYRHLPHILQNIPFHEMLFGSGLNTSGHRFTQFFGQYADSIWTVESDFVNGILNKGVFGIILQYGFLLRLIYRLRKTGHTNLSCFIFVLIISGFIYDNQFIWVLLLEYMLYCQSYQSPKECLPNASAPHLRHRPGL